LVPQNLFFFVTIVTFVIALLVKNHIVVQILTVCFWVVACQVPLPLPQLLQEVIASLILTCRAFSCLTLVSVFHSSWDVNLAGAGNFGAYQHSLNP
jgi:hypothetical protein